MLTIHYHCPITISISVAIFISDTINMVVPVSRLPLPFPSISPFYAASITIIVVISPNYCHHHCHQSSLLPSSLSSVLIVVITLVINPHWSNFFDGKIGSGTTVGFVSTIQCRLLAARLCLAWLLLLIKKIKYVNSFATHICYAQEYLQKY